MTYTIFSQNLPISHPTIARGESGNTTWLTAVISPVRHGLNGKQVTNMVSAQGLHSFIACLAVGEPRGIQLSHRLFDAFSPTDTCTVLPPASKDLGGCSIQRGRRGPPQRLHAHASKRTPVATYCTAYKISVRFEHLYRTISNSWTTRVHSLPQ